MLFQKTVETFSFFAYFLAPFNPLNGIFGQFFMVIESRRDNIYQDVANFVCKTSDEIKKFHFMAGLNRIVLIIKVK